MNTRLLALVFIAAGACGCNPNPKAPLHGLVTDPAMLGETAELRQENTYLVKLEMSKTSYSLKLGKHIANAASAEHHWILVGEETYNQWKKGQEISSNFDWAGLFSKKRGPGSYKVTVEEKVIDKEYLHLATDGKISPITESRYQEELEKTKNAKKHLIEVPLNGGSVIYVRNTSVSEADIVSRKPLKRHYFDIEISNSSFTFSLSKMLSNELNKHSLTIEVSEKQFSEYKQDIWKPELNTGSLAFKGRLSTLSGKIIRRWDKDDPAYEMVWLKSGEELIMKK